MADLSLSRETQAKPREEIFEERYRKLCSKRVNPDVARKMVIVAGVHAVWAHRWTVNSYEKMMATLRGSSFNDYEILVHSLTLLHRVWSDVVSHPGSVDSLLLRDSFHRMNWEENQRRHLELYHLTLPAPGLPIRSLRVLRGGLVLLPWLL